MGGRSRHVSAKRRQLNSILRLNLELDEGEGNPTQRALDFMTHSTRVPPALTEIKSNVETGSQQVSPVKGSPVLCVIRSPVEWGGGSDHYHF